jgi:uncharacterized membrane protein YsdA (DUF1294 family)
LSEVAAEAGFFVRAANGHVKATRGLKNSDLLAAVWFGGMSVVTFAVFGLDKWRAGRGVRRVPELTLVLLGAMGGWVGGWIGMNMFRHKTAKWSFKLKYAAAVIPFAAEVWAVIRWR